MIRKQKYKCTVTNIASYSTPEDFEVAIKDLNAANKDVMQISCAPMQDKKKGK